MIKRYYDWNAFEHIHTPNLLPESKYTIECAWNYLKENCFQFQQKKIFIYFGFFDFSFYAVIYGGKCRSNQCFKNQLNKILFRTNRYGKYQISVLCCERHNHAIGIERIQFGLKIWKKKPKKCFDVTNEKEKKLKIPFLDKLFLIFC